MPETGMGVFPDVGGGWFLPRLPGRVGAYLATAGARIDGADCRAVGIATHYMNSDTLDGIKGDIIADPASIESILNNAQVTPPPAKIEAQRADNDRLFASDSNDVIQIGSTACWERV